MISDIKNRKSFLTRLKKNIVNDLNKCPKGKLKVSLCRGVGRFYYIDEKGEDNKNNNSKNKVGKNGKYLGVKDFDLVKKLVQKEYLEKLVAEIEKEIFWLEEYENRFSDEPWNTIIQEIREEKRRFIKPPVKSDEERILAWKGQEYTKLEFKENSPEYFTKKGLRVRSKTEILIADILDEFNVPYLYEKPLELKKGKKFYPDFTILDVDNNREIYWEHLGMMDDLEYRNHNFNKLREYEDAGVCMGVNLLVTFETQKLPINTRTLRKIIKEKFVDKQVAS